jgi:23S rRNA pseudouridine1911/1915/1917 synthase
MPADSDISNGAPVSAGLVTVGPAAASDAGVRLDRWLAARLPEHSRARLQDLIRSGRVTRGGRTIGDPGARVKPGDVVAIEVPPPTPAAPAGEAMALVVVYEDAHLIVIDKPAGLVVHPSAGHETGTLVNALIAHCGDSLSGIGGVRRPGIVHRLDKDTSGLLVVAKTDAAHRGLAEQFAAHGRDGAMERAYTAVVWGVPERPTGRIEGAIGRSSANRLKMAVVAEAAGRSAITHYGLLRLLPGGCVPAAASLLRLELETGRTHQIRVHMAHIGHPLLGDPAYGAGFATKRHKLSQAGQAALARLGRQALHAAELGFVHPVTGRRMRLASPLPADLANLVETLE